MKLAKSIALTVASVAIGSALIGGGTMAYFSGQATSENNTFAAGSISLAAGTTNTLAAQTLDLKVPGDTGSYKWGIKNSGTNAIKKLSFDLTAAATENVAPNVDFANSIIVTSFKFNNTSINLDSLKGADGQVSLRELSDAAALLINGTTDIATGNAEHTVQLDVKFQDTGAPQNELQSAKQKFSFTLEARSS